MASILDYGVGVPRLTRSRETLIVDLPLVPTRLLSEYAIGRDA
jgi:hypothetical protein